MKKLYFPHRLGYQRNIWHGRLARPSTGWRPGSPQPMHYCLQKRRSEPVSTDGRCPRCGSFNEDFNHVVCCQNKLPDWQKAWSAFTTTAKGPQPTCHFVIHAFCRGMASWIEGQAARHLGMTYSSARRWRGWSTHIRSLPQPARTARYRFGSGLFPQ
jgi:hypothetical protein